jgi:hypothetical protein
MQAARDQVVMQKLQSTLAERTIRMRAVQHKAAADETLREDNSALQQRRARACEDEAGEHDRLAIPSEAPLSRLHI